MSGTNTPTRPFNTGRDCSIVFISASGTRIDLSNVTGFMAEPTDKLIRSEPLGSPPTQVNLPNGWSGSFDYDRNGPAMDNLVAAEEATYWATGQFGTGTLYQYVNEPSGTQSAWQFDGLSYKLKGARWAGDALTKQTVEFVASTRKAI